MLRALRFLGLLIVHAVVAIIGTAIVESAIWRLVPAHSVVGVLWKECVFSVTLATLIGFGMWRTWRIRFAKWAWVLPAIWFAFGFLTRHGDVWGGLFGPRSVLATRDTRSFFAFTVPLFRAGFYSAGAYVSSRLSSAPVTPLDEIVEATNPADRGGANRRRKLVQTCLHQQSIDAVLSARYVARAIQIA